MLLLCFDIIKTFYFEYSFMLLDQREFRTIKIDQCCQIFTCRQTTLLLTSTLIGDKFIHYFFCPLTPVYYAAGELIQTCRFQGVD
jgi:hypothetical protein